MDKECGFMGETIDFAGQSLRDPGARMYEATPEVALASIAAHQGSVLVDLDETLYLRNSTEDFIDLAWPGLAALILLRILEVIKPWRWTGGEQTRDVWRVQFVRFFFPWTLARWRSRVRQLSSAHANVPLLAALLALPTPPTIVTLGFLPIVTPLLEAMGPPDARIIGARAHTFADRRGGKLLLASKALGEETLKGSLVLTDSKIDLPLLRVCACPLLTVWPGAHYRPALSNVYLPGLYTSEVKRPGQAYFRRAILQEDFALWVLCSIALSASPLHHIFGLLLLLMSFWTIYESGYVDNDLMGAKLETDPELSSAFHDKPVATPFWPPWIWATACAVAGIALLHAPPLPTDEAYRHNFLLDLGRWEAVLVCTYVWFVLYNRSAKSTRVGMFPVLQFARSAAFTALVPILPIGAMAIAAHVLARWTPYYLYRLLGRKWPVEVHGGKIRILFFAVMAVMLAIAYGWPVILNWTTAAILALMVYRARHEFGGIPRVAPAAEKDRTRKDA